MSQEIKSVRTFDKGTEDAPKVIVCINQNIFISAKQLAMQGYKNAKALIGANIDVEFYKKGEELINGVKCSDDNKIVKQFTIEHSESALKYAGLANEGVIVKL